MNNGDDGALPEGWALATLGEIADCRLGKMLDQAKNRGDLRPYLRNVNVQWGRIDLDDIKEMRITQEEAEQYAVRAGDLLVCEGGEPGRCAVWIDDREMYLQKALHRVRPRYGTSPEYLRWCLQDAAGAGRLEGLVTGSTIKHLPGRQLAQVTVALPPVPEQRRIAAQIDEIETRRGAAATRLQSARTVVERFRSATLAAASSGRLTEDWRNEREGDSERLMAALRQSVSSRSKGVAEPDPALVPRAPPEWARVTLDLLIVRIEAGKSFSAHGRPASTVEWGIIKVSAMSWGSFLETENKAVPEDHAIKAHCEIRPGDLLISRANTTDLVGATVLVGETRPRLLLSDKSLRLIPRANVDKAWLNYALRSPFVRSQFSERATGTSESMRNLSQDKILATTLMLPPLPEQQEIARRVDVLLETAGHLSARIDHASARLDRVSKASLGKAFRGELVPTEAAIAEEAGHDFESAEEFLARVSAASAPSRNRRPPRRQLGNRAARRTQGRSA